MRMGRKRKLVTTPPVCVEGCVIGMSLQILSLNSNQVPACAAAQEKILALLSSGEGAMEPKQFGTAKELFYALAEALKTAQTILLLVEPERYLRTKEQLLRAMGQSTEPNTKMKEE